MLHPLLMNLAKSLVLTQELICSIVPMHITNVVRSLSSFGFDRSVVCHRHQELVLTSCCWYCIKRVITLTLFYEALSNQILIIETLVGITLYNQIIPGNLLDTDQVIETLVGITLYNQIIPSNLLDTDQVPQPLDCMYANP